MPFCSTHQMFIGKWAAEIFNSWKYGSSMQGSTQLVLYHYFECNHLDRSPTNYNGNYTEVG